METMNKVFLSEKSLGESIDDQIDFLIEQAWKAFFQAAVFVRLYRYVKSSSKGQGELGLVNSHMSIFPTFDQDGDYLIARVASGEDVRLCDQMALGGFRFEVLHLGEKTKLGHYEFVEVTAKRVKKNLSREPRAQKPPL